MNSANVEPASAWMRSYVVENLTRVDLDSIIDRVGYSIAADVPELSIDAEVERDLKMAVRSQFQLAVAVKASDDAARWVVPLAGEAYALARTIARRGLELRVLSQLYHAAHRAVLRLVTEFVHSAAIPADLQAGVVVMLWERTSDVMNSMLDDLSATYNEERERLLSGEFSMRVNTVRELLDGHLNDSDIASSRLGYPVHKTHTCMILWTTEHAISIDSRVFEPLALRLARSIGAADAICVPSGLRGLWVWTVTSLDEVPIDPDLVPSGIRVALGRPGIGIDGFRQTHREAQAAQSIADTRQSGAVTSYREVELVSMLSAQPDTMATFVARELTGLLDDDDLSIRLRETLRAVLAARESMEAASRMLAVHKNTVRYRIQQAEQRLGRSITDRALHLELALECFEVLGTTRNASPAQSRRDSLGR